MYYVDAGHTVSYDSILAQTQALVDAFGADTEVGADILQRFADLEARLEEVRAQLAGKTVMVLQSAPPSHYIQTNGGTLGSMAEMLGLTNVYENDASSMAQLDYETALSYDPDLVLCVGMSKTGEGHRALMEEDFANNPDYWNSIPAIAAGDVIYLPVSYISSAGINVVDNINALADIVLNHFGAMRPSMNKTSQKRGINALKVGSIWLFLIVTMAVLSLVALSVGSAGYSIPEILRALLSGEENTVKVILYNLRLPRLLLALLIGASLSASGALLQSVMRKPPGRPRHHRRIRWRGHGGDHHFAHLPPPHQLGAHFRLRGRGARLRAHLFAGLEGRRGSRAHHPLRRGHQFGAGRVQLAVANAQFR